VPQKFQNLINGKWVDAKSGRTFENRNPANLKKSLTNVDYIFKSVGLE